MTNGDRNYNAIPWYHGQPETEKGSESSLNGGLIAPLLSQRRKIERECVEWCKNNNVEEIPFNIITAASALGYLRKVPK